MDATFAYALAMQAPAGIFEGLVTLGWSEALRLPKSICADDAGAMTAAAGAAGCRIVPVGRPALPWWPCPFAPEAPIGGLGARLAQAWRWRMRRWPVLVPRADVAADAQALYRRWCARADALAWVP